MLTINIATGEKRTLPKPSPVMHEDGVMDADDIRTRFAVPNGSMTVLPTLTLVDHYGRTHRFEWHRYLGPTFLRADGEPMARYPSERNPLWRSFNAWMQQGRRVDVEGNCIWLEPCGAVRAIMESLNAG